jgi:hypothetical protein
VGERRQGGEHRTAVNGVLALQRERARRRAAGRFLLLAAALALLACTVSEDLSETERAVLLTERDLRSFGLKPTPDAGKYKKTINRLDQSRELTYVFEPDGFPLYLSSTLRIDSSAASAVVNEGAQKTGLTIGLKATGVDTEPVTLREKYGERASLTLLTKDGKPVGNIFTMVSGKKVYISFFTGIYFNDLAEFHRLITPMVAAVLKYDADAR